MPRRKTKELDLMSHGGSSTSTSGMIVPLENMGRNKTRPISKQFTLVPFEHFKTKSTLKDSSKKYALRPVVSEMKHISDREREIWHIKELKPDVKPDVVAETVSKPSPAIARLTDARNKRHEETRLELCRDIEQANADTEQSIQEYSSKLKQKFKEIADEIECIEKRINNTGYALLAERDFAEARKKAADLFGARREAVDLYKNALIQLEKKRSEKTKLIFRKCLQKFKAITYQSPDVNDFFDQEILEYNQTLLNNNRCYADIHLQLIATGDEQQLRFKRLINCVECLWQESKKKQELEDVSGVDEPPSALAVTADGAPLPLKTAAAKRTKTDLLDTYDVQGSFHSLIFRWADAPNLAHTDKNVLHWSDRLTSTLLHLDGCSKTIFKLYRRALLQVLHMNKLNNHELIMERMKADFKLSAGPKLLCLIANKIVSLVKKAIKGKPQELAWDETLSRMSASVVDVTRFLVGAVDIWERHFRRLRTCARVMWRGIDKCSARCNNTVHALEVKFNMELDILRQANDYVTLEASAEKVEGLLNDIRSRYDVCFIKELKTVKKYPALVLQELEVFQAETAVFMLRHPRGDVFCDYIDSNTELPSTMEMLLPQHGDQQHVAINVCAYQMDSIDNWKLGLWEGMEHYVVSCRSDVTKEADRWVKAMTRQTADAHNLRRALHVTRYQRVTMEVHHVRLAEVNQHYERLASHRLGVTEHLIDMSEDFYDLLDELEPARAAMEKLARTLATRINKETRPVNCAALVKKLDTEIDKHTTEFRRTLREYREDCKTKIDWLRESNTSFIKAIKMFSEGGDFSAREATMYLGDLSDVFHSIEKERTQILKLIQTKEVVLVKQGAKVTNAIRNQAHYVLEDLVFCTEAVKLIQTLQESIKQQVTTMLVDWKELCGKLSAIETAGNVPDTVTAVKAITALKSELGGEVSASKTAGTVPNTATAVQALAAVRNELGGKVSATEKALHDTSTAVKELTAMRNELGGKVSAIEKVLPDTTTAVKALTAMRNELSDKVSAIEKVVPDTTTAVTALASMRNDLIEHLMKRRQYLLESPVATEIRKLLDVKEEPVIVPQTRSYLMPVQNLVTTAKDFLPLFFGALETPPDKETFLSSVCLDMWTTFGQIQDLARKFYDAKQANNNSPVVKTEMLQPSYNLFMEEMLSKFRYYFVQCIEVWLARVKEYLEVITQLKEVSNASHLGSLEMFQTEHIASLSGLQSAFLLDLSTRSGMESKHRSAQERRLLPLHGYPGNRGLRETLNDDVLMDFESRAEETIGVFFKHKEHLQECRSTHDRCLTELLASLAAMSRQTFNDELTSELAQQLEDVCKDMIARHAPPEAPPEVQPNTGFSYDKTTVPGVQKPVEPSTLKPTPKQYKLSLENISTHAESVLVFLQDLQSRSPNQDVGEGKEQSLGQEVETGQEGDRDGEKDDDGEKDEEVKSQEQKPQPVILEPLDVNVIADCMSKEYEGKFNECFHELNVELIKYKRLAKEWIQTWKTNVEKVKEIYAVTYDCNAT